MMPRWVRADAFAWLIGAVSFVIGMAGGLWVLALIGSTLSLEPLGMGAYVLLIVVMALGGAVGFATGYAAIRWLMRRTASRGGGAR
jgi:hypothetical protein